MNETFTSKLVIITVKLRSGIDLDKYDKWMATYEHEGMTGSGLVSHYSAWKIVEDRQGSQVFDRFDLMFLKDFEDVDNIFEHPAMIELNRRWRAEFDPGELNISLAEQTV